MQHPARAVSGSEEAPRVPLLLRAREAAAAIALSPRKLWELTNRGEIPCVRIGRAVRYDRRDLLAWIEHHKVGRQNRR